MLQQHSALGVLLFLLALACPGLGHGADKPNCSRPLTLALHDHGLLYSVETGTGIDKDIAEELIRRSGCRVTVSVLPRNRIWQLIESGALDFGLSGIANGERTKFAAFAWYFSNKYYLLLRKDTEVRQVADFWGSRGLRLGVIRGFGYSPSADQLVDELRRQQRLVYSSGGLAPLYETLLANRIQAMIVEPFDYPVLEEKRIQAITSILPFDDPPVPHGLVMSRKSLSPEEQEKWRALIGDMRADGTVLRIFEKYFKPELARALVDF
ncbi:MAG TPA: transporter substrate-binding domain-containing protein [Azospira sp.]|nr:transporter substrate-binding domain-containing protein [Azospira sp.]